AQGASAQKHCMKGIPCGNTCISATRKCRTATTAATAAATLPATTSEKSSRPVGASFVASRRGHVYYWVGCSAWKSLSKANLIYFKSAKEAETAGYRPSKSEGCGPPASAHATTDQTIR